MRWSQEGAFWLARLWQVSRKEWWSVWPDWGRGWRRAERSRAAEGSWDVDWGRALKLTTSCKGKETNSYELSCVLLDAIIAFICKLYTMLCVACVFEIPSITPTLGRAELLSKLLSNADTPKSFRSRSSRADSITHNWDLQLLYIFIVTMACNMVSYSLTYQQLTLLSHWWGKKAGRLRSSLTRCWFPGVREGQGWVGWQQDLRGCWRTDSKGCPPAKTLTSPEGERKWS